MKTRILLSSMAVTSFAALSSNAATVMYNASKPVIESGSLGSNLLTLPQFDPSLGTLSKVEITVNMFMPSFVLQIDNDTTTASSGSVSFGTQGANKFFASANTSDNSLNVLSGDNFQVDSQLSAYNVDATTTDSVSTFDPGTRGDNFNFTTDAVTIGQISQREINSAVWGQYTGSGVINFDLQVDFVTDLNVNPGGGVGDVRYAGIIPTGTFAATVTYTYEPIPETSTVLLGAFGALALLRRRRR